MNQRGDEAQVADRLLRHVAEGVGPSGTTNTRCRPADDEYRRASDVAALTMFECTGTVSTERPRGLPVASAASEASPVQAGLGHGSTGFRQDRNLMSDSCPGAVALGLEFEPNLEV